MIKGIVFLVVALALAVDTDLPGWVRTVAGLAALLPLGIFLIAVFQAVVEAIVASTADWLSRSLSRSVEPPPVISRRIDPIPPGQAKAIAYGQEPEILTPPKPEKRRKSDGEKKVRKRSTPLSTRRAKPPIVEQSAITAEPGECLAEGVAVDLLIGYCDLEGAETQRQIVIHELWGSTNLDGSMNLDRVRAHCLLRRRARTFSLRNMMYGADPETGEIIEDLPTWIARQCGRPEPVRGIVEP